MSSLPCRHTNVHSAKCENPSLSVDCVSKVENVQGTALITESVGAFDKLNQEKRNLIATSPLDNNKDITIHQSTEQGSIPPKESLDILQVSIEKLEIKKEFLTEEQNIASKTSHIEGESSMKDEQLGPSQTKRLDKVEALAHSSTYPNDKQQVVHGSVSQGDFLPAGTTVPHKEGNINEVCGIINVADSNLRKIENVTSCFGESPTTESLKPLKKKVCFSEQATKHKVKAKANKNVMAHPSSMGETNVTEKTCEEPIHANAKMEMARSVPENFAEGKVASNKTEVLAESVLMTKPDKTIELRGQAVKNTALPISAVSCTKNVGVDILSQNTQSMKDSEEEISEQANVLSETRAFSLPITHAFSQGIESRKSEQTLEFSEQRENLADARPGHEQNNKTQFVLGMGIRTGTLPKEEKPENLKIATLALQSTPSSQEHFSPMSSASKIPLNEGIQEEPELTIPFPKENLKEANVMPSTIKHNLISCPIQQVSYEGGEHNLSEKTSDHTDSASDFKKEKIMEHTLDTPLWAATTNMLQQAENVSKVHQKREQQVCAKEKEIPQTKIEIGTRKENISGFSPESSHAQVGDSKPGKPLLAQMSEEDTIKMAIRTVVEGGQYTESQKTELNCPKDITSHHMGLNQQARILPVYEDKYIPQQQETRQGVLPMSHKMDFEKTKVTVSGDAIEKIEEDMKEQVLHSDHTEGQAVLFLEPHLERYPASPEVKANVTRKCPSDNVVLVPHLLGSTSEKDSMEDAPQTIITSAGKIEKQREEEQVKNMSERNPLQTGQSISFSTTNDMYEKPDEERQAAQNISQDFDMASKLPYQGGKSVSFTETKDLLPVPNTAQPQQADMTTADSERKNVGSSFQVTNIIDNFKKNDVSNQSVSLMENILLYSLSIRV